MMSPFCAPVGAVVWMMVTPLGLVHFCPAGCELGAVCAISHATQPSTGSRINTNRGIRRVMIRPFSQSPVWKDGRRMISDVPAGRQRRGRDSRCRRSFRNVRRGLERIAIYGTRIGVGYILLARQRPGGASVTKSFRDWLSEGEQIYATTMGEFKSLESQLEALE